MDEQHPCQMCIRDRVWSMDWAAWAWVASASSSRGGVRRAVKKMASQKARMVRTWDMGQRDVGEGRGVWAAAGSGIWGVVVVPMVRRLFRRACPGG